MPSQMKIGVSVHVQLQHKQLSRNITEASTSNYKSDQTERHTYTTNQHNQYTHWSLNNLDTLHDLTS